MLHFLSPAAMLVSKALKGLILYLTGFLAFKGISTLHL